MAARKTVFPSTTFASALKPAGFRLIHSFDRQKLKEAFDGAHVLRGCLGLGPRRAKFTDRRAAARGVDQSMRRVRAACQRRLKIPCIGACIISEPTKQTGSDFFDQE